MSNRANAKWALIARDAKAREMKRFILKLQGEAQLANMKMQFSHL